MTDAKLTEVFDLYEWRLTELPNWDWRVLHMRMMVPQMREFLEQGRREKVMRWLGFMQGALWSMEAYTLDELMSHNAP